ncbi:hypothetical protein DO021_04035 [Desulfobacter hydrogenophilus]|uniref:Uncharacterized protein n=1 Tax=Desulfobacter hydrogenophilus TaxID=2291 RepID=A0A328FHG7_9BACT|nr:hypothetical protein [Desulfobacter hydrogenophilus]NDY73209.1 hypothetical protein [Desulfobacter hydrogenophilus]QBH12525.1 hypothetical protein EYB58_06115 [Desulfobacter hydrogenophilus]RAM03260.1 hypothetical protein DO021_04035 [Desulfobacter hydrogenophilus]
MKIHKMLMLGIVVLGMILFTQNALPHCRQSLENGYIDWTTGSVTATGHAGSEINAEGKAVAMPGSARAFATRNLIAILKQMKISGDLTVGEYASTHDTILAGIETVAQDARVRRQLYTSALDVDVWVTATFYGGFLQLVLPDHIRQIPKINELKQDSAEPIENAPSAAIGARAYTGLIVDARRVNVEPVLYPTIVSEQGREIYSSVFISREFAVQNGVCAYVYDMDQALSSDRAGSNPLVVKALRKTGDKTGAIVMSIADAKTLDRATERHTFLKKCRVIVVVNPAVIKRSGRLDKGIVNQP